MLQINPGEVWLTRNGEKARIYAIDGRGKRPIHGALLDREDDAVIAWTAAGQYWLKPGTESDHDLIKKCDWRKELKPIWAVLKPEYQWIAMDEEGFWYVYIDKPRLELDKGYWKAASEFEGLDEISMPTPACRWYETLTGRP
jgi:hypothetical protein